MTGSRRRWESLTEAQRDALSQVLMPGQAVQRPKAGWVPPDRIVESYLAIRPECSHHWQACARVAKLHQRDAVTVHRILLRAGVVCIR
jgi:hypothetical protein